jgi:hypothetical protein
MGKSKVIINKFYNETFDFLFEFILYDYSEKKQFLKVHKRLVKSGVGEEAAREIMKTSQGFCSGGRPFLLVLDVNEYDLTKKVGVIELLKTLSHECGHVRGHALEKISEEITKTDTEVYQRISDWAFKKCLGTKFIKSLLSPKEKQKCTK